METTQWAQGIGGEGLVSQQSSQQVELLEERSKKRPLREQALNCPRCNSTNTKFCYYNNYSLTQPRYFCKACKRYWTEGGSLRNVPVGGGSRKNKKRSSSINPSSSSSSSSLPKPYQGQDLNLTLPNNSLLVGNNNFSGGGLSTMELLNTSAATSAMYGGSFGLHEFNLAGVGNGGRLLFPFGDLMSSNESDHQIKGQVGDNSMFWSGTNLGGSDGSW